VRQREHRAGEVGGPQPNRAATTSAKPPAAAAPIRHPYCDMPEPTPSWRGSEKFDAVGVDHDIERGSRHPTQPHASATRKAIVCRLGEAKQRDMPP